MRRALAAVLAVGALVAAGCGDDEKTVTDTATVTSPTSPAVSERDQILAAARGDAPGADVTIRKQSSEFAVTNAVDFRQILKKQNGQWEVVYSGNGRIPPAVVRRFGIPPEFAE